MPRETKTSVLPNGLVTADRWEKLLADIGIRIEAALTDSIDKKEKTA